MYIDVKQNFAGRHSMYIYPKRYESVCVCALQ